MTIFERKIYRKMLDWKSENNGSSALLIEGARRIGKSTIVKQFAKKEYKTHILIDFNIAGNKITSLFDNRLIFELLAKRNQSILTIRIIRTALSDT